MPARRRYIDPKTGDYALASGGLREDMTPASRVVLRLRTKRGSIPGLPRFGSRLFEVRKVTNETPASVRSMVREALDDLIKGGELPGFEVTAAAAGSAVEVVISYRDPAGRRRSIPFVHTVTR